jgi:predicted membrane protein
MRESARMIVIFLTHAHFKANPLIHTTSSLSENTLLISNLGFCYFTYSLDQPASLHFSRRAKWIYTSVVLAFLLITLTLK